MTDTKPAPRMSQSRAMVVRSNHVRSWRSLLLSILCGSCPIATTNCQSLVSLRPFHIELTPGFRCGEREPSAIKNAAQSCLDATMTTDCGLVGAFAFLGASSCHEISSSVVNVDAGSIFFQASSNAVSTNVAMQCIQQQIGSSPACLEAFQSQVRGVEAASFLPAGSIFTTTTTTTTTSTTIAATISPTASPTASPTVSPTTTAPTRQPSLRPTTAAPVLVVLTLPPAASSNTNSPTSLQFGTSQQTNTQAAGRNNNNNNKGRTIAGGTVAAAAIVMCVVGLLAYNNKRNNRNAGGATMIASGGSVVIGGGVNKQQQQPQSQSRAIAIADASLDDHELQPRETGLSNKDSLSTFAATNSSSPTAVAASNDAAAAPVAAAAAATAAVGGATAVGFWGRLKKNKNNSNNKSKKRKSKVSKNTDRVLNGNDIVEDLRLADSQSLAASTNYAASIESFEQDRRESVVRGGAVKKDMMGSPLDVPNSKRHGGGGSGSPRRNYDQFGLYCSSAMEDIEASTSNNNDVEIRSTPSQDDDQQFSPDPSWDPDDNTSDESSEAAFGSATSSQKGLLKKVGTKNPPRYNLQDVASASSSSSPKERERRANTPTKFLR